MPLIDGMPLHPLLVHAPIALVPASWVLALAFAVRPGWRRRLGPWVASVALLAALVAVGAAWSGGQLAETLDLDDRVERHEDLGELTRSVAVVAAALALAVVALDRGWRAAAPPPPHGDDGRGSERHPGAGAVTAGAVLLGVVSTVAVVALGLTGHAGASLTWRDRLAAAQAGDEAAGAGGRAPTVVATVALEVTLGEWDLTASATELRPGTHTIRFRNAGTVPHALRLRSEGDGPRQEWRSDLVPPGGAGELTVQLATGTYTLDCPVESVEGEHDALGMEQLLMVHERARSTPITLTDPATAAGHVEVLHFSFAPHDIEVAVGDEVTWRNTDEAVHSASGEGWSTGALDGGRSAAHRFDTPGRHPYVCDLHPSMTGVVIVHP